LYLRVGAINGVSEHDEYATYAINQIKQAGDLNEVTANLRVATVREFEPDLQNINERSVGQMSTGWKAKVLTSLSPRIIRIKQLSGLCLSDRIVPRARHRYMHLITV
jgi:hypothetical protein